MTNEKIKAASDLAFGGWHPDSEAPPSPFHDCEVWDGKAYHYGWRDIDRSCWWVYSWTDRQMRPNTDLKAKRWREISNTHTPAEFFSKFPAKPR